MLYLNKYVETNIINNTSYKFKQIKRSPKSSNSPIFSIVFVRIVLARIETLLLVRKSPRNETGLFALLSLCSRLNQSEDV